MSGLIKFVAAVGLALGIGAVTAHADVPVAKPEVKTFSIEQLGQILEGLGLDAKPIKDDKGAVVAYKVPVNAHGFTFNVILELTTNKQYIVATVGLTMITDPGAVPPEAMLKLMRENSKFVTAHFALFDNGLLVLNSSMSVNLASPVSVKNFLDSIGYLMKESAGLWKMEALGQKPAQGQKG